MSYYYYISFIRLIIKGGLAMEPQTTQDLRDSADFLQENRGSFIDFLGRRGYNQPEERAEQITDSLYLIPQKIFAAKKRIKTLFAMIENQNFRSADCFLSEYSAYLELKDILDLI